MRVIIRKKGIKWKFKPLSLVRILCQNNVKTAAWRISVGIDPCLWQKCRTDPVILIILRRLSHVHIINFSFFRIHILNIWYFLKIMYVIDNSEWPHANHFDQILIKILFFWFCLILGCLQFFGYFDHIYLFYFKKILLIIIIIYV